MKSFIEQAKFYASYHTNPVTRYTHFAGIPLIILSLMIFLGFFQFVMINVFEISFAVIGTILVMIYYFRLNWQLSLALTPIMLILLWISSFFSSEGPSALGIWSFIITFVAGWAFQLAGHFVEGKRPALMDNLCQAMIAPLFLVADLLFMANLLPDLQKEIYSSKKSSK